MSIKFEHEKIFREKAPLVCWCPSCNVPLLRDRRCEICGEIGIIVRGIAYPRDVRYCFNDDKLVIIRAIEDTYNISRDDVEKLLISQDEVVLLNKVQHVDAADEVICRGRVIGVRYFDIARRRWFFRFDYAGIKIAIDNRLGYYAILSRRFVEAGDYVSKDSLIEGILPNDEDIYVPFKLKDKEIYGLLQVRRSKFRIIKVIRGISFSEAERTGGDIVKVLKANVSRIERLEELSKHIISSMIRKYRDYTFMTTVSGGKDSTVILYLAHICNVRNFVYCDTGFEFPETKQVIEKLSKITNIDIIEADREAFDKMFNILGPPARDFRWCTQICKLEPLKRYIRSRGFRKIASVTGQRLFESPQRALAGYEKEVYGSNPADVIVSPLYDWTALEVELYITYRDLPLNELYIKGFERVGCYICPTLRCSEIEIIKKIHPSLWSSWFERLKRYRRKINAPDVWLRYDLWRWRFELPGDLRNYLRGIGVTFDISSITNPVCTIIRVDINRENLETIIEAFPTFLNRINMEKLISMVPVISREYYVQDSMLKVYTRNSIIIVNPGGRIYVWSRDLEICKNLTELVMKLVYMTHSCIKCGECVNVCERGILELHDHPIVTSPQRCDQCRECVKSCIVAKYVGISVSREINNRIA